MSDRRPKDFGEATATLQRSAEERRSTDSAAHLRWIQAQLEAIERGNFELVFNDAHDDVTLEIFGPPQFPFVSNAHGKDEFLAAVTHNFGAVIEQHPQIQDIFAEADTVILFGRERGRVRDTGIAYDVEFVERFTFRDRRLASVRIVVADTRGV